MGHCFNIKDKMNSLCSTMDSLVVVYNIDLDYGLRSLFREIGCTYSLHKEVWFVTKEQLQTLRERNVEIECERSDIGLLKDK